jgi:hypothetical protein
MKKYGEKFNDEGHGSQAEKEFYDDASKLHFSSQGESDEKDTMARGHDKERHAKEETNLDYLGKWIGGMCKKCMCCCRKTEAHSDDEDNSAGKMHEDSSKQDQNSHQSLENENRVNLDESNIENENEIINFSSKVNPDDYHSEQKQPYSVYLHIKGERSREKRMYMLVQHLDIYYDKNQHIVTLSNFLGRPYALPERPSYLKEAKFNNYRPFQTLYEVANTSIFCIQKEAIVERSLELNVHVLFNMERVGDPNGGPGKKLMEGDIAFKIYF